MRHRGFYGLLYGFVLVVSAAVALAQDGNMTEGTELLDIDFFDQLRRDAEQNAEQFIAKLRHRAEQGDVQAQWELGFFHWRGLYFLPKDDAEAVKWYRKAAEQGHPGAQFHLGRMYAEGKGVPQDDAEAKKWYRLASEQGHEEAQNALKGEIWRCFAMNDYNKKTALFTLARKRMGSSEFGRVLVASTTQWASFRITGLNRRWDFGDDESEDVYPYAFVIKPDGTGLCYDFSTAPDGTASAIDSFNCLMSPFLIWGAWGELK